MIFLCVTVTICVTLARRANVGYSNDQYSIIAFDQLDARENVCIFLTLLKIQLIDCQNESIVYDELYNPQKNGSIAYRGISRLNHSTSLLSLCSRQSKNCQLMFINNLKPSFTGESHNATIDVADCDSSAGVFSQRDNDSLVIDAFYTCARSKNASWSTEFARHEVNFAIDEGEKAGFSIESEHYPARTFLAFIYNGFVYFLRKTKRPNLYSKTVEQATILNRICLNDLHNKELRSFISSPLFVDEIRSSHEIIFANFDPGSNLLKILVQSVAFRSDSTGERSAVNSTYKIYIYHMGSVASEIDTKFNDCYNRSDAFDVGILKPKPGLCWQYRMFSAKYKPCNVDICSPTSCILNPRYHIESYKTIEKTNATLILPDTLHDKYGRPEKFEFLDVNLLYFVTSAGYIILTTVDHAARVDVVAVAHSNIRNPLYSTVGTQRSITVLNGTKIDHIFLQCGLFATCAQALLARRCARIFSNCGWCHVQDGISFSSTREECQQDSSERIFFTDRCPPYIECFVNNFVSPENSTRIEVHGHFEDKFVSNSSIYVCGTSCQLISSNLNELICEVSPPFELNRLTYCEISMKSTVGNFTFEVGPVCDKKLFVYSDATADEIFEGNGFYQSIFSLPKSVVLSFVGLCLLLLLTYTGFRCLSGKKLCVSDSGSHWYNMIPIRTFSLSHPMNTYVPPPSGHHNYYSVERLDNFYDDLSYLVPERIRIPWNSIVKQELIGMGHFGEVYKGVYKTDCLLEAVPVAMKTLRIGVRNIKQFVEEGVRMECFNDGNVLSLIGIAFNEFNYPLIVMPFMVHGDLLSYIRNANNHLTVRDLLDFAMQVSTGLKYLHKLRYIHRDLAARNCMLDENLCVKVADFGLSRDVYESEFYLSVNLNADIPIRWLPLESIERQEYSPRSDIWSYGVTLWEIVTRGMVPYSNLSCFQLLEYLKSGHRLPMPKMCPHQVYELMKMCWHSRPEQRPDSEEICVRLPVIIKILESDAPDYYNMLATIEIMSQYETANSKAPVAVVDESYSDVTT